jgi:hypothetical protein
LEDFAATSGRRVHFQAEAREETLLRSTALAPGAGFQAFASRTVLYSEGIVMRKLNVIGSGVLFSFLAVMSGCALDGNADQPGEQALDGDPSTSTQDDGLTVFSTPTCNWVASFAGAWVPFFNSGSGTVDCNMVKGDHSAGVQKLQHSMNLCYGEHLAEDSDFGQATKDALIRTQRTAHTPADGEYGPNTRKAMLHERVGGGPCIRVP